MIPKPSTAASGQERLVGTKRSTATLSFQNDFPRRSTGSSKKYTVAPEKGDCSHSFRRLVSSVPKKLKRQTKYMRFKNAMMEDASIKGDKEKLINIAQDAKDGWKLVKNMRTSLVCVSDKENIHNHTNNKNSAYLIDIKQRAEHEHMLDNTTYDQQLKKWRLLFQPVATLHLEFLTQELLQANDHDTSSSSRGSTYHALLTAVQTIERIQCSSWTHTNVSKTYVSALVQAKQTLYSTTKTRARKSAATIERSRVREVRVPISMHATEAPVTHLEHYPQYALDGLPQKIDRGTHHNVSKYSKQPPMPIFPRGFDGLRVLLIASQVQIQWEECNKIGWH